MPGFWSWSTFILECYTRQGLEQKILFTKIPLIPEEIMNIHSADTDISQAISQTQTLQPPKLSLKLSLFPLEAANTYMAIER